MKISSPILPPPRRTVAPASRSRTTDRDDWSHLSDDDLRDHIRRREKILDLARFSLQVKRHAPECLRGLGIAHAYVRWTRAVNLIHEFRRLDRLKVRASVLEIFTLLQTNNIAKQDGRDMPNSLDLEESMRRTQAMLEDSGSRP